MKTLIFFLFLMLFTQLEAFSQDQFRLKPLQSMLMTGKGPGQDGTINPYTGQDCYAIVNNTGTNEFYVRIQKNAEIIEMITVPAGEKKKIKLLAEQELYLDSNEKNMSKVEISYEPFLIKIEEH